MTRFQLVFRHEDGERSEIRDNNTDGGPQLDGTLIVDGETYTIRGVEWVLRREDMGDMPRFICTVVTEPVETADQGRRA